MPSGMRVTTIRVSEDLWEAISNEAARSGVSASQFIREAALARAATAAGARGELLFQPLTQAMRNASDVVGYLPPADQRELQRALAVLWRALSGTTRADSAALRAQSEQAKRHAHRRTRRREDDGPAAGDDPLGDEPLGDEPDS